MGVVVSECLLQSQEEDTAITICQACMPSSPLLSGLLYLSVCNVRELQKATETRASIKPVANFLSDLAIGQDQMLPENWAWLFWRITSC